MSALWWKCGLFPIFCCFRNTAVDNHVYMSIPIISSPVKRVQTLVILIVQICFNFSLPWNDETFVWMCYEKALSYSCLDSTLHLSSCLQIMYSFSFSFNNVSQARQCQNDYIILSWFYSYCKEFIIPWSAIAWSSISVTFNCIFMTKATIVPRLLQKIYVQNYNIKRFLLFSNTQVGKYLLWNLTFLCTALSLCMISLCPWEKGYVDSLGVEEGRRLTSSVLFSWFPTFWKRNWLYLILSKTISLAVESKYVLLTCLCMLGEDHTYFCCLIKRNDDGNFNESSRLELQILLAYVKGWLWIYLY